MNHAKICGITTDGDPYMTGRTIGFTKRFMDAVGAQDEVVSHCIILQDNLCANVMAFAEVMNNIVQCVNYISEKLLNHRQFKAFQEYLDCGYPDVVYFSAVQWLIRAASLKMIWHLRQKNKLFMESKQQK